MPIADLAGNSAISMATGRDAGFTTSLITGTIAAALAQDSIVFAMLLGSAAPADYRAIIKKIRLQYTTGTAFTTPVTLARRIGIFRGTASDPTSGFSDMTVLKQSGNEASRFTLPFKGFIRIASTGALSVTGAALGANPIAQLSLAHVGASGGYAEALYEFTQAFTVRDGIRDGVVLKPGELLAIKNPVAMDAAGTWQLMVTPEWVEGGII